MIIETIEKIQVLERENQKKLLETMDQVKEKLRKIRNGQKSVAVYDSGMGMVSGSFLDKRK